MVAKMAAIARKLQADFPALLGDLAIPGCQNGDASEYPRDSAATLDRQMHLRLAAINQQAASTSSNCSGEILEAARLFLRWMEDGTVVRVIGAGRARLAAAIPANRLAHGGARVFVQDDFVPMPHTIKGGGIIAASASGKTPSVLHTLASARQETRDVQIVGIAAADADDFKTYCDIFIGIVEACPDSPNPLRALADSEEYVISELLDAIVVAAGALGGFSSDRWRIGHENIGQTGPYDLRR